MSSASQQTRSSSAADSSSFLQLSANDYFDVDAILAEEERIPCRTLGDFSYLAELDPDHCASTKRRRSRKDDDYDQTHHLPEGTRLHLPLWAVQSWAQLGYCQVFVPKQYQRKARERLESDPTQAVLATPQQQPQSAFFTMGQKFVTLIQQIERKFPNNPGNKTSGPPGLAQLVAQGQQLQQTLVKAYTGDRFAQTLDWSWTAAGEDVTQFYHSRTVMEGRLFATGAQSSQHWHQWLHRRRRQARPPPRRLVSKRGSGTDPNETTTEDARKRIRAS